MLYSTYKTKAATRAPMARPAIDPSALDAAPVKVAALAPDDPVAVVSVSLAVAVAVVAPAVDAPAVDAPAAAELVAVPEADAPLVAAWLPTPAAPEAVMEDAVALAEPEPEAVADELFFEAVEVADELLAVVEV